MRAKVRTLSLAWAAILLGAAPAHAEPLPAPDDAMVDQLAALARANLTRARLPDGSQVPPETPEELALPIVPAALVRQSVARGFLTAEMHACALDWVEGSFRPYMARLRASGRYGNKQMAYVGMLHGAGQGVAEQALAARAAPCSDAERRRLVQVAAEMPILTP